MSKKQKEIKELKVGLKEFIATKKNLLIGDYKNFKLTVTDDLSTDDDYDDNEFIKNNSGRVKGKELFTFHLKSSKNYGQRIHRLDGPVMEIHDELYMNDKFYHETLNEYNTIYNGCFGYSSKFEDKYAIDDEFCDNKKDFEKKRKEFLEENGIPTELIEALQNNSSVEKIENSPVAASPVEAKKPLKKPFTANTEISVKVANTALVTLLKEKPTAMDKIKKTVKSDLGHVAKRVAVKKTSEFAQKAILDLLASNKTKEQASKLKQQFTAMLSTEDGRAAFNIVVGTILPLISGKMPENLQETVESLAQEFRTDGMSHFAIEFVDYLSGDGAEKLRELFQKNLEAIQEGDVTKIRVSTETPSLHELIAPAKKALDFVVDEKVEIIKETNKV